MQPTAHTRLPSSPVPPAASAPGLGFTAYQQQALLVCLARGGTMPAANPGNRVSKLVRAGLMLRGGRERRRTLSLTPRGVALARFLEGLAS